MTDLTTETPMHPELVTDAPQTVRWVLPPGTVPFAGPVRHAPGTLGQLLEAGVVAAVECESCAVLITLADSYRWADLLADVRVALSTAIRDADWLPVDDHQLGADALLSAAVTEVLTGPAGDYVRSHGGRVEVASASDDRVEVTFCGTCGHCPATGITLHDRLETEIRHKYPALQSIVATNAEPSTTRRLFSIRRRLDR